MEMENDEKKQIFLKGVFKRIQRMELSRQIILLWIFVLGLACISFSMVIDNVKFHFGQELTEKIGEILLIVGLVHYLEIVYRENEMRKYKNDELKIILDTTLRDFFLENTDLKSMIESIANKVIMKRDSTYKNLQVSGIKEVLPAFDITKALNEISHLSNCKIRINVIFLPYCERVCKILYEAILLRNCQLELIICDPSLRDALEGRRIAVNADLSPGHYARMIKNNINELNHLYNKLPAHLKQNMAVKKHRSFIGASLWGYGETFWVGSYLSERMATDGTNIKVKGYTSFFFQELRSHFKAEWNRGTYIIGGVGVIHDLS